MEKASNMNWKNYYDQHYKKIVGILLLALLLSEGVLLFLHFIEPKVRDNLEEKMEKENYPAEVIEEKCGYTSFSLLNVLIYAIFCGFILWEIVGFLFTLILILSKKHIVFRIAVFCFWGPYFAFHIYAFLYACFSAYTGIYD